MNKGKFNKLKVGDEVTLAATMLSYDNTFERYGRYNGRFDIPAGTKGVVGAVKVPSVTGRRGAYFACVDVDANAIRYWREYTGKHKAKTTRCGCFPSDLV